MPFDATHPDFAEAAAYFGFRPDMIADLSLLRMSPERKAARRLTFNCSEAPIISKGDPDAINRLARIKWGEIEEPELDAYNVDAGNWMEPLILAWAEEELGIKITRRGERVTARRRPWLSCTLDGWAENYRGGRWVIQTKFFHSANPVTDAANDRAPQVLMEAYCTGAVGTLLVIYNQSPKLVIIEIPADAAPQAALLERIEAFWEAVQEKRLPFLPTTPVPIAPQMSAAVRAGEVLMNDNAEWTARAKEWLENKKDAETNEATATLLKKAIPGEGPCRVNGAGVEAERDARGSVRLRVAQEVIDLSKDNRWCDLAHDWKRTLPAVEAVETSAAALKKLLPPEAKAAIGAGVKVSVNAKGAVSLTKHTDALATAAA